ncbi:MAG TPA: hypothetical protein VG366_00545 [Solirubrobacteraceae bacterium]|nr:hypothetical protein [Solirubrobacteraceae bacterium]
MSSVRAPRRPLAPRRQIAYRARRPLAVDRGALLLLAAACVVLFAGSFLIARVLSPAAQAGQGALPRIAAQAGEPVPLSLTPAPAIRAGVAATPRVPVKRVARLPAVVNQQPVVPAVAQAPVSVQPVAPVAATPAPVAPPPPAAQTRSAPPPKSSGGGGAVSFDTSG